MAGKLSGISTGLLVCVAILAASATAQAHECITGWITHVDRLNDTIALDSGDVLLVSGDINFEDLSEGVRVKLVVRDSTRGRKAVRVAPANLPTASPGRPGRV